MKLITSIVWDRVGLIWILGGDGGGVFILGIPGAYVLVAMGLVSAI